MIFDIGEQDGKAFIAMEFLDGMTLGIASPESPSIPMFCLHWRLTELPFQMARLTEAP
ncbi:MAG: hypothetical protein WBV69_21150 [Candidatus Sulfotelmatobacter sp.]